MPKPKKTNGGNGRNGSKAKTPTATIRALKAQVKKLQEERDHFYRKMVELLPRRKSPWTRKDLREMERSSFSLDDFIKETEKMARAQA